MLHMHRCRCTCPTLAGQHHWTPDQLLATRKAHQAGVCMQPYLHTATPSAPQAAERHVSRPSAVCHLCSLCTHPSPLSCLVHPLLPRRWT